MSKPDRADDLASATKALTDALSQFTKSIGTGISQTGSAVTNEVTAQLSASLHEAAQGLNDTSNSIVNRTSNVTRGGDRRRIRAQQTREELLVAARKLFAMRGYEGASVVDIAKEAGVTKGALYANFSSKEELFLEIAAQLSRQDASYLANADPHNLAAVLTQCAPDAGAAPGESGAESGAVSDHQEDNPSGGDERALSDTLERTLLGLEAWTYAVRHPESRVGFGEGLSSTLDRIATMVAECAGRSEPIERDRDVAFGLVAFQTVSQILGTILGPQQVMPAAARLTQRLLEE